MTVLVSVKINDGVVMAADGASSFASGMIYHHAEKIMNHRRRANSLTVTQLASSHAAPGIHLEVPRGPWEPPRTSPAA